MSVPQNPYDAEGHLLFLFIVDFFNQKNSPKLCFGVSIVFITFVIPACLPSGRLVGNPS
jgi:hypothetical protein